MTTARGIAQVYGGGCAGPPRTISPPMSEERPDQRPEGDDPKVPDLHLDRLERLAREAPADLVRRAEEAIERHAPALAPRRLRSRVRKRTVALLAMLGLMAALVSAWTVLRETTIIRQAMESQLSERLGGDVAIGEVTWDGWNRVKATDLVLRARGWEGEPGRVASIRRAEIVFAPTSLLTGSLELVDMEIDGLSVSIVERADRPGSFNLLALTPAQKSGGGVRQPRSALLRDIRIERAMLDGGALKPVVRLAFAADFAHLPDDPSVYRFTLMQTEQDGAAPAGDPIRVSGTWNERTLGYEATLEPMDVGPSILGMLPVAAREWARRAGLVGRIERATVTGSPDRPVRAADVSLREVRLRDRSAARALGWGRMDGTEVRRIDGDVGVSIGEANLKLAGSEVEVRAARAVVTTGAGQDLLEIPVEGSLRADLAPAGGVPATLGAGDEWLSRALALTPFRLAVRIPDVDTRPLPDGRMRRVELPIDVADALGKLGLSSWRANLDVTVERAAAVAGTPSPVRLQGTVDVLGGRFQPPGVPVALTEVAGRIELQDGKVALRGIRAKGPSGATVEATGTVQIAEPTNRFDVGLRAAGFVVDAALVESLPAETRRVVRQLLDDEAWDGLRAAGMVEASTRPGGTVGADVRIVRDARGEVDVRGTLSLADFRLVIEAFPYPLAIDGTLRIGSGRVELPPEGLAVRTPFEGRGRLRGHVLLPEEGVCDVVSTYITFEIANERLTRTLLACLPPSFEDRAGRPEGWPGSTFAPKAEILMGLGLEGRLAAGGTVRTRADGSDAVILRIEVSEGRVRPSAQLASILRRHGLSWPGRMPLDGVAGVIEASADTLRVRDGRATLQGGTIRVEADFPGPADDGWLSIDLEDFPFERNLARIVEGDGTDAAVRAWDAFAPTGRFDASVFWERQGERTLTWANARPRWMELGGGVRLDAACGALTYRDGEVRLEDIDLRGTDADGSPLRIEADGTIVGAAPDFRASVEGLRIASPVVAAAVRAAELPTVTDFMTQWRTDGSLDVAVSLPATKLDAPWEVTVVPTRMVAERDDRRLAILHLGGDVAIGPAGARIDALELALDRGVVRLDGAFGEGRAGGLAGELSIAATVDTLSPGLRALFPKVADDALEAISFRTDASIWTDGLRIVLDAPADGERRVMVTGEVGFGDASFDPGIELRRIDGAIAFDLATVGGRAAGTLGFGLAQLEFLGRRATDVAGVLAFDGGSGLVRLEELEASMYGGRIAGRGSFDPGDGWQVHVSCANVGFGRFVAAGGALPKGATLPAPGSDGTLRGRFDASGAFGDGASRRGSGRVAVAEARMMEFPLGMSLLQLTQLMLPLNASMESASVRFDLTGDRLAMRDFDLESGTLRLEGEGELDTDDGALSLRLRNRGRFPILSDLYGIVSDQVFAIDVGGTINDPQPALAPMPGLLPRTPAPDAPAADPTAPTSAKEQTR